MIRWWVFFWGGGIGEEKRQTIQSARDNRLERKRSGKNKRQGKTTRWESKVACKKRTKAKGDKHRKIRSDERTGNENQGEKRDDNDKSSKKSWKK